MTANCLITMNKGSKIYVAGHSGLVGSAIVRKLLDSGYKNLVVRTHKELDLIRQSEVEVFFEEEKPEFVFLAAARVGGILANSTYKADFIYQNIMIAANVIHASYKYGVKKLLNLGSSCIYPKFAPQPLLEEHLLTGSLELTNEPYAIAKISAIKLCRYFNEQYGTNFISVMPANLYGLNDNFDLETSHVLPALIRKFHLARLLSQAKYDEIIKDFQYFGNLSYKADGCETKAGSSEITANNAQQTTNNNAKQITDYLIKLGIYPDKVVLWGSGSPYREFLHGDDLADACIFLIQKYNAKDIGEFVNIGSGNELKIKDLAYIVKDIVRYKGEIQWDTSKPDGTPRKLLNVGKINNLGWKANIGLHKGIEEVYRTYLIKTSIVNG